MTFVWLAVYTHPKCEDRAAAGVDELGDGYQSFLPKEKRWVRHARYKTETTRPLFARYLFVGVHFDRPWSPISRVDGVRSVLCNDGVPARIPLESIAELRGAISEGMWDETREIEKLNPGASLRVVEGPMNGFLAKLKKADTASQRAEVLLSLFGKDHALWMEFSKLRVAS